METKVGNEYIINTEEFCALDSECNKRFFLKEIRPEVHSKINEMWDRVAQIEEINCIYPSTFVYNTKKDIYNESKMPEIIRVVVIKQYKDDYYLCKELFHNNKFIISSSLLHNEFQVMDMIGLDLYIKKFGTESINLCMDMFAFKINPPRKVRRKLKKDTK